MDPLTRITVSLLFTLAGVAFAATPFILVFGLTALGSFVKKHVFKIAPKPLEEDYGW